MIDTSFDSKRKKGAILLAIALFLSPAAFSQTTVFIGLSPEESTMLSRGQAVFRSPSSWRGLAIPSAAKGAAEILGVLKSLNPNYIGEMIMIVPKAKAGDDALTRLADALENVEGYKGIPYWSKSNKMTFDLFDKSVVVSRSVNEGTEVVEALQHMEPFDEYTARYSIRRIPGAIAFSGENRTRMVYSYKNVKILDPGKLRWMLNAYEESDHYVLYGVGAAKAFDFFGLFRDKVQTSLLGRIQAFFGYEFGKI